jgi:flagellar motor switch protein FliM
MAENEQNSPATGAPEGQKSEAELAAEWAAAAEGGGGETNKTLSQAEIDSLLGFGGGEGSAKSGIHALLDKALLSYERLPMLEIVFDRFVRTLSTSLRNFTSDNVEVSIDSITSMRFEDYLNSVPLPALLCIFQAVEWENFGIITIYSNLTYSMVDVLLGGGRTNRPVKIEGRPFTTIEQDIIKSLTSVMLDDMSTSFNPLTPITFRYERLESNPRFASITRPSNAVILITLRVDMEDRGGKAEILLPYVTLDPVKELLVQLFTEGNERHHNLELDLLALTLHLAGSLEDRATLHPCHFRKQQPETTTTEAQHRISFTDAIHLSQQRAFVIDLVEHVVHVDQRARNFQLHLQLGELGQ